jgi:putative membrane protein
MTWNNRALIWAVSVVSLGGLACDDDEQRVDAQRIAQEVGGSDGTAGSPGDDGATAAADAGEATDTDAGKPDEADGGEADGGEDAAPGDAEIGAILAAVNAGEIEQADYALLRSDVAEVRAYAHLMLAEHTAAAESLAAILSSIEVEPSESDTSRELRASAATALATLQSTPSPEFNLAYIAAQAAQHEAVLALIDALLLPNAESAELREYLETLRASVTTHLQAAQGILENPPVIEPAAPAPAEPAPAEPAPAEPAPAEPAAPPAAG